MTNATRLGAFCPDCGEIELGRHQMWLVVASAPDRSYYGFHCPACGRQVRAHASAPVIAVLERLVVVERLEIPAEALEPHTGPALTMDDLLDLMLLLECPDASLPVRSPLAA